MSNNINTGISDLFFNYEPAIVAYEVAPDDDTPLVVQARNFISSFEHAGFALDITPEALASDFIARC